MDTNNTIIATQYVYRYIARLANASCIASYIATGTLSKVC